VTLMSREGLDPVCEKAILAIVLAILTLGPLAFGAAHTLPFIAIQTMTALVLALWATRIWLNRRFQFLWPPLSLAFVAFAVYAIARYRYADIEYVARQELLRVLTYTALFLAIVNNLHRKEAVQIISFSLVFLAMAIYAALGFQA
jgi:hypothetical protein